jgi:hypothetical protein
MTNTYSMTPECPLVPWSVWSNHWLFHNFHNGILYSFQGTRRTTQATVVIVNPSALVGEGGMVKKSYLSQVGF